MAAIDYTGIVNKLQTILEGDSRTADARIYVEEEPQIGLSDNGTAIAIFAERRAAPPPEQVISAGKRTRYYWQVTLWVVAFNLESYRAACEQRNALLGQLELVLMADRSIGGLAESSWLEGGEMFSARDANNTIYTAVAQVLLTVNVSAINA